MSVTYKEWNMNEMYQCINRNARPNNNQLIAYYKRVSYLQRIHTIPCIINLQQQALTKFFFFSLWGQSLNVSFLCYFEIKHCRDPTVGPEWLTLFLSTLLVKGVFSPFPPDCGYFYPTHSALPWRSTLKTSMKWCNMTYFDWKNINQLWTFFIKIAISLLFLSLVKNLSSWMQWF